MSSLFYSRLRMMGIQGVRHWMTKRSINIFKKKLILVPINKAAHWSLAVIVHPDRAVPVAQTETQRNPEDPFPCIIFMDPLDYHCKRDIQKHLLKWLNAEWNRLNDGSDSAADDPFNENSFGMFAPASEYPPTQRLQTRATCVFALSCKFKSLTNFASALCFPNSNHLFTVP